ncbi:elongator complex protein 3 [Inediibacterium massiliense]|uniref:elongator complex protein 3 n=1 Tax=Inediibacterium massiliense TaxID=1658111 RepID=UPI0006B623D5|nr:radical SAM protein [Inediibacterium massiliense]
MAKKHYIIPIFVPHRGCPFDCVFCNQKKITGCEEEVTKEKVNQQIIDYMATIQDIEDKHVEIAFFGGSFTGIEQKKQQELLEVAYKWKNKGVVNDIRISTRPDYINESIVEFLEKYGVSIIGLGVQSMDEEVLKKSNRGHTPKDVIQAVEVLRKFNVQIGLQMMIGLPLDTLKKAEYTASEIIKLKPHFVRIYPTLVIKGTYLEKMYERGEYDPLSIEKAVSISKKLLLSFMKYNIPVIRIGLQPTENILLGREVIAGPFHPAFRQLVESKIFKEVLDRTFSIHKINHIPFVKLRVHEKNISNIVGHKKENIDFIEEKYKIHKISISKNNDLKLDQVQIFYEDNNILYSIK